MDKLTGKVVTKPLVLHSVSRSITVTTLFREEIGNLYKMSKKGEANETFSRGLEKAFLALIKDVVEFLPVVEKARNVGSHNKHNVRSLQRE